MSRPRPNNYHRMPFDAAYELNLHMTLIVTEARALQIKTAFTITE